MKYVVTVSIRAPRAEGDMPLGRDIIFKTVFQSAPSRGGRLGEMRYRFHPFAVSIRALAWRAIPGSRGGQGPSGSFNPRALAWRAIHSGQLAPAACIRFNPRPRVEGDHHWVRGGTRVMRFQSAPSRGGRSAGRQGNPALARVSIRALAWRAILIPLSSLESLYRFNPLALAWRAIGGNLVSRLCTIDVSIRCPRVEGDLLPSHGRYVGAAFQSCASRGGRSATIYQSTEVPRVSIRALAWRAIADCTASVIDYGSVSIRALAWRAIGGQGPSGGRVEVSIHALAWRAMRSAPSSRSTA